MLIARSLALAAAIAAGTAVVAGAAVLALRALSRSMTFPGSGVAFPSEDELARSIPGASLVRYAAPGGPSLTGALVRTRSSPGAGGRVIVWFHGNAESAAGYLPLAAGFANAGFDVFLAEYRGYGGNAGRPSEAGLYADGEAALDALSKLGYRPAEVVLVGNSLGTGVAAELAVRRPPALLLLISPFTSAVDIGRTIAGPLAPLLVADRFDTLSKIGRVRSPVVILHGALDEIVPVTMGRRLAAACPGARYVEVPGASHNDFPGLPELVVRELRGR
jgi:fermentation-respiration switch protein FrsA (DUF1100 family)